MIIYEGQQVISTVQAPGVRSELAHERVIDLKHIHAVEAGEQPLVALIVGRAVQHAFSHDGLVVAAQDLANQIEVLLERIRKAAQASDEVPVQAVGDVKPQSVDVKILHPVADRVKNVPDHRLVSEVELHQIIMAFPALVPEAVVIGRIAVEAHIEPVLIGGLPLSLQNIDELCKAAAYMIEDAVQDHADPFLVQSIADFLEVLIGAEPAVDLLVVPRVVAMSVRFKDRTEIDRRDPQLFQMGDPALHLQDPVCQHAVIFIRRAAHSQRVNLINHAFFSPHSSYSSLSLHGVLQIPYFYSFCNRKTAIS